MRMEAVAYCVHAAMIRAEPGKLSGSLGNFKSCKVTA